MKPVSLLSCILCVGLLSTASSSLAGPLQRVPTTTLAMPASPPSYNYTSVNALGSLTFLNPVAIASPPGETNRLFVVEKNGAIIVITNLAAPTRSVFLNISNRVISTISNSGGPGEQGLLGLAFHPGYATNGFFYVFYTTTNETTVGGSNLRHDVLSRFTTNATNPNQALTNTELKLIRQRDEADNHNGGDLHFGPDGYLYLSLGDEGGGNDQYNNSQTITKDFFSGMLRLDVDKRPDSLNPNPHASIVTPTNYAVPPDNPLVHTSLGGDWTGAFNGTNVGNLNLVRTEFWAVGLRNPWRFSFDPVTDILYCGDVGQGAREEIDIIVRGGNYGWAYREGLIAGPRTAPAGFTSINPILSYDHTEGISVTGGIVYRGSELTELHGAYIFADYGGGGRIWASRYNGISATPRQLLFSDAGISAFGTDPRDGDVLFADVNAGTIRRMVRSTATSPPLPTTLAATGAFTNLATLTPHAGIVPYDLNVPFWSDNAHKTRWFTVTNINRTIGFNATGNWSFATSSVWIKHFELELTNGVPESRKRLETRFIVRTTNSVYGATYRWGDSPTNATLVPDEGTNETFVIYGDSGILRTQVWHYPSRTECVVCHTAEGGFALGFNTHQLNREFAYDGIVTNQLRALSEAGYFSTDVTGFHTLRSLVQPTNGAASLEYRVRSYLAANCVQCHQPGGSAPGSWDARVHTPGPNAGIIDGPLLDNFGDADNRVVVPGSISNSVMLTRIAMRGTGQMPPLATSIVDTQAVELIAAWITNDLPSHLTYAEWQIASFGSTNAANSAPTDDADGDRALNDLEYLTGTDPNADTNFWSIVAEPAVDGVAIVYPQVANRAFEIQATTNLLDGGSWLPLDVSGNEPYFWITNRNGLVHVATTNESATYFRARVIQP